MDNDDDIREIALAVSDLKNAVAGIETRLSALERASPASGGELADPKLFDEIKARLEVWEIPFSMACDQALGEQLGERPPLLAQIQALRAWVDLLDDGRKSLAEGGTIGDHTVQVLGSSFGRYRPVVRAHPGRMVWAGPARLNKEDAADDGARAAIIALTGASLPPQGEDDEPDPAVVEAHRTRLAEAMAQAKATNEASAPPEASDDA